MVKNSTIGESTTFTLKAAAKEDITPEKNKLCKNFPKRDFTKKARFSAFVFLKINQFRDEKRREEEAMADRDGERNKNK